MNFRDSLIRASEKEFEASIEKHRILVEILLEDTFQHLGQHVEKIERQLDLISGYEDKLSVLKKYFKDGKSTPNLLND